MKTIPLTHNTFAFIDDADFELVSQFKWWLGANGYAYTTHTRTTKSLMHRMLLAPPKGQFIDHIDGNRLNNQRSNLRLCTYTQNQQNTKKRIRSSSLFKGVFLDQPQRGKRKWSVQIQVQGKREHIGRFENERHAALAYDLWAKDLFGEFAKTNFPVVAHG